jgi:hypothetical protein
MERYSIKEKGQSTGKGTNISIEEIMDNLHLQNNPDIS